MTFDKVEYEKLFDNYLVYNRIKNSEDIFKIKLFLEKAENSLQIAKFVKDMPPTKDLPKKLHWNYWAITLSY